MSNCLLLSPLSFLPTFFASVSEISHSTLTVIKGTALVLRLIGALKLTFSGLLCLSSDNSLNPFVLLDSNHLNIPMSLFRMESYFSRETDVPVTRHLLRSIDATATEMVLVPYNCLYLLLASSPIASAGDIDNSSRSSTNSFARIMDLFPAPPPLHLPPTASSPGQLTKPAFLFPRMDGKLDKHGDFETEEIDLTLETHKADWFVELCECYSLPTYGTKPVRWDRLVKFSQSWNGKVEIGICLSSFLFTPTHIPHKGVRNGSVTKRKPPKLKDTCSQMVVDRIVPWALSLLEKTAQETASAKNLWHTHLPEQRPSGTCISKQQTDLFENPDFAQRITSIIEEHLAVYQSSSVATVIEPLPSSEFPCPSMDIDTSDLGLTTASADIFPSDVDHSDSPMLPSPEPSQAVLAFVHISERAPRPVASSNDASGKALQCMLTFANGTKHLIQSWDDSSTDWAPPSDHPIIIHGCPIPIKDWGELYRFNKMANGEWGRLKSHWSNWQFFMEAYRAIGTPEAFWSTFSDSRGHHLKFTYIMKILKEECQ
ncbi:hypothetical protein F5146DRAFT_1139883 [Armillaria mellea]|nr:hypothetical protein F5146DRAFT_1139883 [Armillaria mellea]